MNEIVRQREEALEALRKTATTVVRLRKLLREQDTYTPEALEQSVDDLMNEFFYTGRRLSARISVLVSLRCGRLK
jgi:hypothetical protein